MPRFAANLSMMFNEAPFLDRFALAAKSGFKAVEFLFPYDFAAAEIAARLKDNGLQQALFNAPPGDWTKGERGMAALPGRQQEFRSSIVAADLILGRDFDPGAAAIGEARGQLAALVVIDLAPALPDISESLLLLRSARGGE